MKKTLIMMVASFLMVGLIASVAFADSPQQNQQIPPMPPIPQGENQDFYQQMWDACHGSSGMMNGYYGNGAAPQGYGMGSMMGGWQ